MSDIKKWGIDESQNQTTAPDGWPEGMERRSVNDCGRETQASVRRWYEDPAWVNLLELEGVAWTLARSSTAAGIAVYTVNPLPAQGDITAKYPVGSRVRLLSVADGDVDGEVTAGIMVGDELQLTVRNDALVDGPQLIDSILGSILKGSTPANSPAFSTVGTTLLQTPGEIPTIDDLGDHVTLDMGDGNGLDADLLDGEEGAYYIDAADQRSESHLQNGAFDIWQRIYPAITATPDHNTYSIDRWRSIQMDLTTVTPPASANILLSQEAGIPGVASSSLGITVANTVSPWPKFGWWIPLTGDDTRVLHDQQVSLTFWAQTVSGLPSRWDAAIVAWTGGIDTLGSSGNPVSDFSLDAVEPVLNPSYTYLGNSVSAGGYMLSSSWQRFELLNINVPLSTSNLGVLLWSDDRSLPVTHSVVITGADLSVGSRARTFRQNPTEIERWRCLPYYEKTGDVDLLTRMRRTNAGTDDQGEINWRFLARKRASPTVNILDSGPNNIDDTTTLAAPTVDSNRDGASFAMSEVTAGNHTDDRVTISAEAVSEI